VTLSISKEERNGEYKAYLKEETTSCLLDNHRDPRERLFDLKKSNDAFIALEQRNFPSWVPEF